MSKIIQGIECDLNTRWEEGMDHHPESQAVVRAMSRIDSLLGGDSLDISTGGDGDNGESMMFCLDVYFEAKDRGLDFDQFIGAVRESLLASRSGN